MNVEAIHHKWRGRTPAFLHNLVSLVLGISRHVVIINHVLTDAESLQSPAVDHFRHAVKVNQQAQENLVRRRAVLVYAAQIAQNRDAGHVLAVKCNDAGRLWTEPRRALGRWNGALCIFMLAIVGGRNFGQEASDHFDNVRHGHRADFVLLTGAVLPPFERAPRALARAREDFFASKALNVRQVADFDASGRAGIGVVEG